LAAAIRDCIRIWQLAPFEEVVWKEAGYGSGNVSCVRLSRDGSLLVSASREVIMVWNVENRETLQTLRVEADDGWVNAIALSPGLKYLASTQGVNVWS
jgi:WD40 repeat protein